MGFADFGAYEKDGTIKHDKEGAKAGSDKDAFIKNNNQRYKKVRSQTEMRMPV